MRVIDRLFFDHPQSVDEGYFEHMGQAFYFSAVLLLAAVACLLHGLLPGSFVKTGSRAVSHLHDRMVQNRNRHAPSGRVAADSVQKS